MGLEIPRPATSADRKRSTGWAIDSPKIPLDPNANVHFISILFDIRSVAFRTIHHDSSFLPIFAVVAVLAAEEVPTLLVELLVASREIGWHERHRLLPMVSLILVEKQKHALRANTEACDPSAGYHDGPLGRAALHLPNADDKTDFGISEFAR